MEPCCFFFIRLDQIAEHSVDDLVPFFHNFRIFISCHAYSGFRCRIDLYEFREVCDSIHCVWVDVDCRLLYQRLFVIVYYAYEFADRGGNNLSARDYCLLIDVDICCCHFISSSSVFSLLIVPSYFLLVL